MRLRYLGLAGALTIALLPRPAEAQSDFVKSKLKDLIEKSGVYVSTSTRSSLDSNVNMDPSFGIGYGTAGSKSNGVKFPFSFSSYHGDLETNDAPFAQFRAQQLMSGIGYQWVFGKMVYSAQLGLGYSFNRITLSPDAPALFSSGPVRVEVSNSFVVRPKVQAEYFLHRKISLRTQLSYTYSDPDVVVVTTTERMAQQWRPHHVQLSAGVGFFPFRK